MRRFLAFFLCLTLLLPLFPAFLPGNAADNYLITIAEDTVLRGVNEGEMAVYIDGIIYAPYTVFNQMKSVFVNYNAAGKMVTVYRVGAVMHFELDTGLTYDYLKQRTVQVSAKMRAGVPYLPVSVVTSWMNMYFSFTSADRSGVGYPIIRMASDTPALSDSVIFSRNKATLAAIAKSRDI
ncbi:MAG: hypothetical protein IJA84_06340, partial [Clostridia bacterium]|nr:hypothetical protein [Clostridia bacterium]